MLANQSCKQSIRFTYYAKVLQALTQVRTVHYRKQNILLALQKQFTMQESVPIKKHRVAGKSVTVSSGSNSQLAPM